MAGDRRPGWSISATPTPRTIELPGLIIVTLKGASPQVGDMPMQGKDLYFPFEARLLLENLTQSRGAMRKSVGKDAVETRLLNICDSRGEESLSGLRETARSLASPLCFDKEFKVLDELVGSILGTRPSQLTTLAGKARTALLPYDADRLALFEKLATALRSNSPPATCRSGQHARRVRTLPSWNLTSRTSSRGQGLEMRSARLCSGRQAHRRPAEGFARHSWCISASGDPGLAKSGSGHRRACGRATAGAARRPDGCPPGNQSGGI